MISNKAVAGMAVEVGFSTAFTTLFFILMGRYIDRLLQTRPIFTLVGIALGLITSLYIVWKIVKSLQKPN